MGINMLSNTERKEIFDIVQEYRVAHIRLADHYRDKRAHQKCDRCARRAGHYLDIMQKSLYTGMQDVTDDDIKCFAVLVDNFEQMQRNRLLTQLQQYAGFDVVAFVGAYNRGQDMKNPFAKSVDVTELSAGDLDKRVEKIRKLRRKVKKDQGATRNVNAFHVIRDEADELAHAVVNNKLKSNNPEYLKSVLKFLDVVIPNRMDGDVVDCACTMLEEKINEPMAVGTIVDNILADPEPVVNNDKPKSVFGKIGGFFKSVKQKIDDKRQERQNVKELKAQQESEAAAEKARLEQAARAEQAQRKLEKAVCESAERDVRDGQRAVRRAERNMHRENRRLERKANFEQTMAVLGKTVSGVVESAGYGVGCVVENVRDKHKMAVAKRALEKRNREIIRDAERESKQHWKKLKREEKQKEEEKKNLGRFYRNLFAQPSVAPVAALVAVAGMWVMFLTTNNNDKTPVKLDKKAVKTEHAKPVVQKQDLAPVAIDTAYASALKNYYNSALDIIAGAKKDDVLSKVNKQIKSGSIKTADYIGAERIAYAYFIYREYGFKIDVLELAVDGNQKLSDAQQAELIQVIMDAGERGTGVQKQAQQRVEARGGNLDQHSKFKNATKQQQRQHLVNLGLLKKVQHVK